MSAFPEGLSRESALMVVATALPVLQRAYRAAADKAVAHVGMSQALAWPLVMIGRQGGGMRQGVLADRLGIEAPSLVRSLDQLVEAGFVERHEDAVDRRAKTLHLTDAGAAACAQIETALLALRATLYDGVADADVAACLRVFAVLEQRLGATVSGLALYAGALADLPAR
ncbi:MarR family transcriptional regulator [Polaromonas sp.]|uniref:MarR family transcriptional regulator n=1 Tax=Polaromonas sp. TaxID=1869339 RepID=UPI003BB639E8